MTLEERVQHWIVTRIGVKYAYRRERAMRLLEEAIELAQAEGITEEMVNRQTRHVFSRPAGEPDQEAAGVGVCFAGWCAATGHSMVSLTLREVERIEAKPLGQIRGSLARKQDADLVTAIPSEESR